jgi:gliding motility-associated-like protein
VLRYIIILFFLPLICNAQLNLVFNGSFEDTISCPMAFSQISLANGWYAPTAGTSDLFHSCSNNLNPLGNCSGKQSPENGNAYAGFGTFEGNNTLNVNTNYREYIQSKLTKKLDFNTQYCINFYLSLADSSQYATPRIGVLFTQNAVSRTDWYPFTYSPQLTTGNDFVIDTVNWIKYSYEYLADGTEEYITIGNFDDSLNSDTISIYSQITSCIQYGAYYYIDNISLIKCEDSSFISAPNVFTPNNDGINDAFIINVKNIKEFYIKIFNRWGTKLFETNNASDFWDGRTTSGLLCENGVYYFTLKALGNDDKQYNLNGFFLIIK